MILRIYAIFTGVSHKTVFFFVNHKTYEQKGHQLVLGSGNYLNFIS